MSELMLPLTPPFPAPPVPPMQEETACRPSALEDEVTEPKVCLRLPYLSRWLTVFAAPLRSQTRRFNSSSRSSTPSTWTNYSPRLWTTSLPMSQVTRSMYMPRRLPVEASRRRPEKVTTGVSAVTFLSRSLCSPAAHVRIIKAFIDFHQRLDPKWDPKAVTTQTPYDIRRYITQKCGPKENDYEGKKVRSLARFEPICIMLIACSSQRPFRLVPPSHSGTATFAQARA
jgi:hypothetical protein